MEVRDRLSTRMRPPQIFILDFSFHATQAHLGLVYCIFFLFGMYAVGAVDEKQSVNISDNSNSENPTSQVRYRTRPVAAFQSGPTRTSRNTSSNSSEADGPEPSGVPFIAVHDLTSQTFERLHENWRNVEAFIRNLHARRSQEESLRSSSSGGGGLTGGGDKEKRPPYNNVYTLKYHPVVLEGEGSSSIGDINSGNNVRSGPPRTFNGISFNPFPFDPKGEESKNVDMEKHTIATIYTIGICLTIMAIGSVMFILINKCDGTNGSHYARTSASSRLTRSVMGVARGGRANNTSGTGRNRNNQGGRRNNENTQSVSGNMHTSAASEIVAKNITDLPPSYDSLFPEGGPKVQDTSNLPSTSSASANILPSVIHHDERKPTGNSSNTPANSEDKPSEDARPSTVNGAGN